MISLFRHHLQSRPLRYTVYAVSFLVVFPSSFLVLFRWFGDGGTDWIVSVNGTKADYAAYQQQERETLQQIDRIKNLFGEKAPELLRTYGLDGDQKAIALNSLKMQTLFNATAKKHGIHIAPSYSAMALMRQLPRQFISPDGSINMRMVEQAYHVPFAQLERQQEQHIQDELLMQLTDGALYVPQFVLKDYFMREFVNHRFLIAAFPLSRFVELEKQHVATAQELKEFFDAENRKNRRYFISERRSGVVWTFDPDHYGITITDNQLKRNYERNKHTDFVATPVQLQVRQILITFTDKTKSDALLKIQQLHQELVKNPELFAQKAQEFSHDAATKNKGGLTNFFARGTQDKLFEQEAFKLATDGAISPIFQTSKGYYIVQRVARKTPVYKSLESVKNQIAHTLRVEQFKYTFPNMVRRFVAQENKEEALTQFAHERNAKQQIISQVTAGNTPALQKLFSVRQGGIGSFITDANQGVAVFVSEVKKGYEPTFESVKTQVTADYYRVRAERALKKVLKEADALTSAEQFAQFARAHGAKVTETEWVNAHASEPALKKLKEQAGSDVAHLFAMMTPGSVSVVMGKDTGYAACLAGIAPFDQAAFDARRSEVALTLLQQQRGLIQQGFVASLCKTATIKVHDKFRV